MAHIIKQIAGHKPRKERGNIIFTQKNREQKVKSGCQRNAYRRRHDQSSGVIRVIMVHAMENKMDPFHELAAWREMKDEPVHEVFGEGPEKQTADYSQHKGVPGQPAL